MNDEVVFLPVSPREQELLRWVRRSRFRDDPDALFAALVEVEAQAHARALADASEAMGPSEGSQGLPEVGPSDQVTEEVPVRDGQVSATVDQALVRGENARAFLVALVSHLLKEGHLGPDRLPLATSPHKHLVAARPLHPSGRRFVDPVQVGDLWVEADRSPADILRAASWILEHLDLPHELIAG